MGVIEKEVTGTVKGTEVIAGDAKAAAEVQIHLTSDPPSDQRETEARVKVLQIEKLLFSTSVFNHPAFISLQESFRLIFSINAKFLNY